MCQPRKQRERRRRVTTHEREESLDSCIRAKENDTLCIVRSRRLHSLFDNVHCEIAISITGKHFIRVSLSTKMSFLFNIIILMRNYSKNILFRKCVIFFAYLISYIICLLHTLAYFIFYFIYLLRICFYFIPYFVK